MIKQHIILGLFWIVYCALHSLLASDFVKHIVHKWLGYRYYLYRIFYTLFAFITLVLIIYYALGIETEKVIRTSLLMTIMGVIVGIAGIVIMAICIKKYFISLSGVKSLLQEKYSNELIITGIHKYVRHPLYLGTFAFLWGLFLIFPYWNVFISNVIITVYTLIGIQLEEEKLIKEFGEQYRKYRQRVPKLFPLMRFKEGSTFRSTP